MVTPCVLPLLPAILAISGGRGRARLAGLVVGIEISFFLIAIALAGAISSIGLPDDALQWLAAGLIGLFGLILIVPQLDRAFAGVVSRLVGVIPAGKPRGGGFGEGFLTGAPLGLVWAPCAGPILAGITVAAGASRFSGQTVVMMGAYAAGMFGPLAAVMVGGRRVSDRLRRILGGGRRVAPVMGTVLLATAVLIGFGWLNKVNQFIAERINLTSTPTASLEQRALQGTGGKNSGSKSRDVDLSSRQLALSGYPEFEELADYGPAPELKGIAGWFNTEDRELSIKGLRGKVVLVDFWTYSCINCIRTLPHLKALHETYASQGLVVLGVHTPEFNFEKDPDNVGNAVRDFGIEYPVALDPEYKSWDNYYNRYWPAHYLIDKDGRLRAVHYGEGAYERTENQIRSLLALSVTPSSAEETSNLALTPETYLGYDRAERFEGSTNGRKGLVAEAEALYSTPERLGTDAWSYGGRWKVTGQRGIAGQDAELLLRFRAAQVHIVAGPSNGGAGSIMIDGPEGMSEIVVDSYRLYTIREGSLTDAVVRLVISTGVEVYALTFG